MPKVTFIRDGNETTVEYASGTLEDNEHGLPGSLLDVAMNFGIPLEDTARDLTTASRLGRQAVIQGDVVVEFPMYTRNDLQEGGGIQLGKSNRAEEDELRPEVRA